MSCTLTLVSVACHNTRGRLNARGRLFELTVIPPAQTGVLR